MEFKSTNRTKISRLSEEYFQFAFDCISDTESLSLWSNIRNLPSKDEYFDFLKYRIEFNIDYQFVVFSVTSNKPIGTIVLYDFNLDDEYLFLSIYLTPNSRGLFFGIESLVLMFDYIYRNLSVRKIYFDVYSYNLKLISILSKLNFVLEGVFIEHRKKELGYIDLHRYSFFMKNWGDLKNSSILKFINLK